MLKAFRNMMRGTVHALAAGLTAPRLFAVLPMALLCAYWTFGERALMVTALVSPIMVLVMGPSRPGVSASQEDLDTSRLLSRNELVSWLNTAMLARGAMPGQFAVITMIIDDLGELERRFGRDSRKTIEYEFVRRLQDVLRQEDTVATLDAGIIAFGLRNVRAPETENLLRLARRLQGICDEPFSDRGARVYCTVSLGIAAELHVPEPGAEDLVLASERAGEFAASSGPGSVRIYTEGLISEKLDERLRARALSNALETGEIFAWFQPQISSDSGRVIGFEALARWDRPGHGVIQPGGFLPDIERAGLSQRLAEVVLKQSLTALNAWDAAGFDVSAVSVNFSGDDLRNPRLADYIMWELDRFGLQPDRLVVEVLESVIAEKHEDAITKTLKSLSKAGCRIDLDDFGTGFTSIINIRRFNVSRIKIDRCLISRLDKDAEQKRMVSALLSFSSKLGIETLAEGVETERESEMLRSLGCPQIQGYFVAKPMPLGETLLWLENRESLALDTRQNGTAESA